MGIRSKRIRGWFTWFMTASWNIRRRAGKKSTHLWIVERPYSEFSIPPKWRVRYGWGDRVTPASLVKPVINLVCCQYVLSANIRHTGKPRWSISHRQNPQPLRAKSALLPSQGLLPAAWPSNKQTGLHSGIASGIRTHHYDNKFQQVTWLFNTWWPENNR